MQNHHGEPERAKKDDGEAPTVDHVMGAPRRDHQQTRASERFLPFGTGSCFHKQHMAKSIIFPPCISKGSSFVHTGITIALAVNLMIRRQRHQAPAKSGMDCCRQSRHGILCQFRWNPSGRSQKRHTHLTTSTCHDRHMHVAKA